MRRFVCNCLRLYLLVCTLVFNMPDIYARAGGGGGRHSGGGGSHSSGGYHSSGGGYHSSGGSYYSRSSGGGMDSDMGMVVFIGILVVIVIIVIYGRMRRNTDDDPDSYSAPDPVQSLPFPTGLDSVKVKESFVAIQQAWQQQQLGPVRRWISDGVYQRYTAQFGMMHRLSQQNILRNIRVQDVWVARKVTTSNYQIADVGIRFSMDDQFISTTFPEFNESYEGDSDIEYWTFIKRTDAAAGKDLYHTNNCPNCGAPLDINLGEISRCGSCKTLTNSAGYDWVLSEITQGDDYHPAPADMMANQELLEVNAADPYFSVQRMEDVASNIFMQVMQVMTSTAPDSKLKRFADQQAMSQILAMKAQLGGAIFDRLYLNQVTLAGYSAAGQQLHLHFDIGVSYRRVQLQPSPAIIDSDIRLRPASMILTKNLSALSRAPKEVVYSHECPCCGAPYTDTTDDTCTYCGEPVVSPDHSWVLTQFNIQG